MPCYTTATELQRNYKNVVKKAKKAKDGVVVLSNNTPVGVYMDYRIYIERSNSGFVNSRGRKGLDAVFGMWTAKEAEEFNKRVDEACERIDTEFQQ